MTAFVIVFGVICLLFNNITIYRIIKLSKYDAIKDATYTFFVCVVMNFSIIIISLLAFFLHSIQQ